MAYASTCEANDRPRLIALEEILEADVVQIREPPLERRDFHGAHLQIVRTRWLSANEHDRAGFRPGDLRFAQ